MGGGMRIAVGAILAATVAVAVAIPLLAPQLLNPLPQVLASLFIAAVPLALSVIVVRAAPDVATGPVLAAAGFSLVATNLPIGDPDGPFGGIWMLLYLPLAVLLVLPHRRGPTRLEQLVLIGLPVTVAAFVLVAALDWAFPATPWTVIGVALLPVFLGLLATAAAVPVVGTVRGSGTERLRLRWLLLAGASLPLTLLLCWTSYLVLDGPELVGVGLVLMYLAIPIGAAIGIVRPTLFDVDKATVATAAATLLSTIVLIGLSIGASVAGLALVHWWPPAAVATVAGLSGAAALAYPRVHRLLDRLLYPERGRALTAVGLLRARIESGAALPADLERVLREALRDPGLRVLVRGLTDDRVAGSDGEPAAPGATSSPVRHRGTEVGAIETSAERARRVPAAVLHAVGPLVDTLRTDAELARARAEVEASRERLLRAGYEERRRLERDLHDGAQQRLVALGMRLRVLQRAPAVDPGMAETLDVAVAELGTAVAELRRIAQGMRPSALDDGLGPALVELTRRSPGVVELDVRTEDLPDAVATTAYFVASEAVTNALRHAEASHIRVMARTRNGRLMLRIDDDGRGGAKPTASGGLLGLADRVSALGGELVVQSRPGVGTTVEAMLPCGS